MFLACVMLTTVCRYGFKTVAPSGRSAPDTSPLAPHLVVMPRRRSLEDIMVICKTVPPPPHAVMTWLTIQKVPSKVLSMT